jgi:hypothetical protein
MVVKNILTIVKTGGYLASYFSCIQKSSTQNTLAWSENDDEAGNSFLRSLNGDKSKYSLNNSTLTLVLMLIKPTAAPFT